MREGARSESQMKLYRVMVVPRAIHKSETQIVRKNLERRLQRAEMKFLCRLAAYTCTDHQHNTEIRG